MKEPFMEPILRYWRIRRIIKNIQPKARLCDIGCGYNARFLHTIKDRIHRGYGFDPKLEFSSDENLELHPLKIGNRIDLPDNSMDCVTMLAVLEHLDDPHPIMKEIARILK